jgi:tyrosinase
MDRYDSDPFVLDTDLTPDYYRADLVFYGVDHSGPSYEGWVFLNSPDATFETPDDPAAGFAGRFNVFGHGGCYGAAGHCDVRNRFQDEFDVRGDHPLTPFTISVDITDAVRAVAAAELVVTVIPRMATSRGPRPTDALQFEHLRIVAYDWP